MIRYIIEFREPEGKEGDEFDNALADHARIFEDAVRKVFPRRSIMVFKMEQANSLLQIGGMG